MEPVDKEILLSFSDNLRKQNPEAVLCFLGNSVALCALADMHLNAERERYIVPFSGDIMFYTGNSSASGEKHAIYEMHSNFWGENIDNLSHYIDFINRSAIAPDKIIPSDKKLVVADRIESGGGIVSFGYLWHLSAARQGYSFEQAAKAIDLCPVTLWTHPILSYTLRDKANKTEIFSGKFAQVENFKISDFRHILRFDNEVMRLSPAYWIDSKGCNQSDRDASYRVATYLFQQLSQNEDKLEIKDDFDHNFSGDEIAAKKLMRLIL